MSNPILLANDHGDGSVDYFHDLGDGNYAIESRQDVTELVEFNKAVQNANTGRWGDGQVVAHIPLVVLEDLQRKGVIDSMWNLKDDPGFRKWLNDPSNRFFRTKLGKV
jgi:hypothetical protein